MAIARFYRKYRSNRSVTFNVTSSSWQYVVIRDTSGSDTWNDLTFNANGTGSFTVRQDISYEIAFTTDNGAATWTQLQYTNQGAYTGSDVTVSNDDPPPPPPPPTAPTELFKPAEMVSRGSTRRRAVAAAGAAAGARSADEDSDTAVSPIASMADGARIARKYRKFRYDQTISFEVGSEWQYVVLRDSSRNTTWGGLRLSGNGRGAVNVRHGIWYELAFTNVPFDQAVAAGLNRVGEAEYAGSDVLVSNDDPPPPPPPPNEYPLERFESGEVVGRGFEHERFWPGEPALMDSGSLSVGETTAAMTAEVQPATAALVAADEGAEVIPFPVVAAKRGRSAPNKVTIATATAAPDAKPRGVTAKSKVRLTATPPKASAKAKGSRPPTSRRGRYAPLGPTTVEPKGKTKAKRGAARRSRRSRPR